MVQRNGPGTTRWMRAIWAVTAVGLCSAAAAFGQSFEHYYGGQCIEGGYGGAIPVINCGGGYAFCGRSSTSGMNNPPGTPCTAASFDSYVVRTSPIGNLMPPGWANTYNIDGGTGNDYAYNMVELPPGGGVNGNGGFIVVGTTDEPGGAGTDAYLMELDCNGNVIWVNTYGSPGVMDEGRDVIIANFGAFPAMPGDYIVAGWTFKSGTQDALLFRTKFNGGLVWNTSYDGGGVDYLMGLDEATINLGGGVGPGDIVGAGGTTSFGNGLQGLGIRVNGNTGAIGMAPQGVSDHGSTANEGFNSVTEITMPAINAGTLVFAGFTTVNGAPDLYVVRSTANPCGVAAQTVVVGANATDAEIAYDVTEVRMGPLACAAMGDIALTGSTNNGSGGQEAFLLTMATGTLGINCSFSYGDIPAPGTGLGTEVGHAIEADGFGFIISALSTSNMNFTAPPDPSDLYGIRPDQWGATGAPGCQVAWPASTTSPVMMVNCPGMALSSPLAMASVTVMGMTLPGQAALCPRRPCIIRLPDRRGNGNDGGSRTSGAGVPGENGSGLHAYPNPIRKGNDMTIEFLPKSNGSITVRVMTVLGQLVDVNSSENTGGTASFALKTDELSAGTYIIEVSDGEKTQTTRVVVTD